MISGKDEYVREAIRELRKLDPYGIFTKERGFAPGDPRRCRGHRYGPREGFHQMEKEFRILDYVGEALKNPREVEIEKKEPVSVDYFKKILDEEENKKEDDKQ
jgi:putative methanogenesis marker protein 6